MPWINCVPYLNCSKSLLLQCYLISISSFIKEMLQEVKCGHLSMKRLYINRVSLQTSEYLRHIARLFGQNGHMLKNAAIYMEFKFKILGKIWLSAAQMNVLNGLGNGLIGNWQHFCLSFSCYVAGCMMQKLLNSALMCHSSLWFRELNQHAVCQGRRRPCCSEETSYPCLSRCLRWCISAPTNVMSSPATLGYLVYWNWILYWQITAIERCVAPTLTLHNDSIIVSYLVYKSLQLFSGH